jgi:hypothetical protein
LVRHNQVRSRTGPRFKFRGESLPKSGEDQRQRTIHNQDVS